MTLDVALHILGAVLIMAVAIGMALAVGPYGVWFVTGGMLLNVLIWPLREHLQDKMKGRDPAWPDRVSPKKDAEAFAPVAAALLLWMGYMLWEAGKAMGVF